MILVHRLKGEPLFVNADLIESIESTPDTVLTLVDGRKALVAESPDVVVERVIGFRAAVLAAAEQERTRAASATRRPGQPTLTLLPGEEPT